MTPMTKEALAELRLKAERATQGDWRYLKTTCFMDAEISVSNGPRIINLLAGDVTEANSDFIAAANPATVLALLDELEAKDKSNTFLKERLAQLANFNPDWDMLEAATDSLREHAAELSAANKRIAEQAREIDSLATVAGNNAAQVKELHSRIAGQAEIISKQEKWIKGVEEAMIAATDRAESAEHALKLALPAMEFMGDTLNNLDAVCSEDVEFVTPAFNSVRAALAAAGITLQIKGGE